jgi:hypothetical protein
MGIMESVKNWIQTQRDPHTLYASIVEIPQPRDWRSILLEVGNDILLSRDISLEASATEELICWIERNLPKIKASGFRQV